MEHPVYRRFPGSTRAVCTRRSSPERLRRIHGNMVRDNIQRPARENERRFMSEYAAWKYVGSPLRFEPNVRLLWNTLVPGYSVILPRSNVLEGCHKNPANVYVNEYEVIELGLKTQVYFEHKDIKIWKKECRKIALIRRLSSNIVYKFVFLLIFYERNNFVF